LTQNDLKVIEKAVGVGKIRTIDSFKREISGRIISMRVAGESGEKMILKELPIRKLLGGASVLRSSCFIAQWQKDSGGFIIGGTLTGAGWGHGVGMCQTGAQAQALAGREYLQILQHYFPKSISVKLY
jgi:SpoIID/LytB domain protein